MPKTITIPPIAAAVLARATVEGNIIRLPEGQLERDAYTAVDKVLKTMGGKWDRRAGGHVFAAGIGDQLSEVLTAGKVVDQKKTLEQFYTPAPLVKRMVNAARVTVGMNVLEPSAGNGAIVRQLRACGARVVAIEIDTLNVMTMVQEQAATLGQNPGFVHIEQGDFLTMPVETMPWYRAIGAVVMNPPFSRNQDIAHVMRAFDILAPGGILVAIMSTHWTFADDGPSRAFRAMIGFPAQRHNQSERFVFDQDNVSGSIERLPDGTFKESGTNVATTLVTLQKA